MIRPTIHPSIQIAMTTREDYHDTDLLDITRSGTDRLRAKQIALEQLGRSSDSRAYCDQVHTDIIHQVTTPGLQGEGDALITDQHGIILQVGVADCTPVVLVGERQDGSCVAGAVHSGRGPTRLRIASQAVQRMYDEYNVMMGSVCAWIGPSASWEQYEFGPEAYDMFDHRYITERDGKIYLSVAGQVYNQLVDVGLDPTHIQWDRSCTIAESERFFSYRRDGQTGQRMFVWVRMRW